MILNELGNYITFQDINQIQYDIIQDINDKYINKTSINGIYSIRKSNNNILNILDKK